MRTLLVTLSFILITGCSTTRMITPIGVRKELHHTVQKIIHVVPKYVVIETDVGIKETKQMVTVYRLGNPHMKRVGTVGLLKYHNGKTVAEIIGEKKGYRIKIGDYVYLQYKSLNEMSVGEYLVFLKRRGKTHKRDMQ